jgi:hypothetical protein
MMTIIAQAVDSVIQLPKSSAEVGLFIAGAYAAVAILDKAMKWPLFRRQNGGAAATKTETTTVATTYGALPCMKHGEDIARLEEAVSTIKTEVESIREGNQKIIEILSKTSKT